MSLSNVHAALKKIAATPSTNDKVELLKKYLEKPTFLKVVQYALDGDKMYSIQKFPTFSKPNLVAQEQSLELLFSHLNYLAAKPGANDADKAKLYQLASIDKETYEVVSWIVKKDLNAGFSDKLVNKARPGTINTLPYMRCSTDAKIDNIKYSPDAIAQEKADGMFVNLMVNAKGMIKYVTRNGKTVHGLGFLSNLIRNGHPKVKIKPGQSKPGLLHYCPKTTLLFNRVYMGELLVRKNGKILDRKTGNGILNSLIQGTGSVHDAECVVFRCWDSVPIEDWKKGEWDVSYQTRYFETLQFVHAVGNRDFVDMVLTERVKDYEGAKAFYARMRKMGKEGAVLKNTTMPWKDGTSTQSVKMKNVSECELKIVGWNYGEKGSKFEKCMGAVLCESDCGQLKVAVGGGWSEEDREQDWDMAEGEIISVEFESVIQDKRNPKIFSLFLPRFDQARPDRSKADTLAEIQERISNVEKNL